MVVFALSAIFTETLKGSSVFVKKSIHIFLLEKAKKNMVVREKINQSTLARSTWQK